MNIIKRIRISFFVYFLIGGFFLLAAVLLSEKRLSIHPAIIVIFVPIYLMSGQLMIFGVFSASLCPHCKQSIIGGNQHSMGFGFVNDLIVLGRCPKCNSKI
jgi:hypothetical protein